MIPRNNITSVNIIVLRFRLGGLTDFPSGATEHWDGNSKSESESEGDDSDGKHISDDRRSRSPKTAT